MSESKKVTAPEGSGDSIAERQLHATNEQNDLLRRLLAQTGGAQPAALPSMSPVDVYCATFPAKAEQERSHAKMVAEGRGLPQKYLLMQDTQTRGFGCWECVANSRSQVRLCKPGLPPEIEAGTIPTMGNHPDEVIERFRLATNGSPPAMQAAILAYARAEMGLESYDHQRHSGVPFARVVELYGATCGRNTPGAQSVYAELTRPFMQRYAGALWESVKRFTCYSRFLEPGEPIPAEYLELIKPGTGASVTSVGTSAPAPAMAAPTSDPGDPMLGQLRESLAADHRPVEAPLRGKVG